MLLKNVESPSPHSQLRTPDRLNRLEGSGFGHPDSGFHDGFVSLLAESMALVCDHVVAIFPCSSLSPSVGQ